jgi:hypothetical protein
MRLRSCLLAIAVLAPSSALAQTPPTAEAPPVGAPIAAPPAAPPDPPPPVELAPPPPAPVPVVVAPPVETAPAAPAAPGWKDLLVIDGLVDSYYLYNFTGENSLSPPAAVRQFDTNSNTFTLNYAKIGLGIDANPVGFRLDLGYGTTGAIINGANGADPLADPFIVQQAYASVSPVTGLTVDFGKFVTTAGAEVIEANKNWLYSRSLLFFNIPLLHTGLRVGYKVNGQLSLQASVVNGWNGAGLAPDVSAAKTYGVSVNYNNTDTGTNVVATGYFGKGEAVGAAGAAVPSPDTRVVGDLVLAQTLGNLGLNLNVDYVNDEAAGIDNFYGVAAMARFLVNPNFAVAGRGEYASNGPGAAGGDRLNLQEVTLGLAFPMANRFELRAEGRADFASQPIFVGEDSQVTGTGAFLAWF